MNIQKIEFQDEILDPVGQSDNKPRYRIRDNSGNVIYDNVTLELSTPVIQEGTALNKAFFDKIEANLEAIANKDNGESFKRYIFEGIYNEIKTPFLLDSTFEIKELGEQELEKNIDGIQSDVSSIKSDITSLETRVKKLEEKQV